MHAKTNCNTWKYSEKHDLKWQIRNVPLGKESISPVECHTFLNAAKICRRTEIILQSARKKLSARHLELFTQTGLLRKKLIIGKGFGSKPETQ